MARMTEDMMRVVREQRLGFIATVRDDGTPSLSPKGTTTVWNDESLMFADIRSPGTVGNLLRNPAVEVNVVDVFNRRGYRFRGTAEVFSDGAQFARMRAVYSRSEGLGDEVAQRMRAIVVIKIDQAHPLVSPAYSLGQTEAEVRATWQKHYLGLSKR